MAETLKSFGDGVERVMERTKSIDHHLAHASHSVLDMLKSLAGIHLIQKSVETMMNNSIWGKTLSKVFSTAKMDAFDLHKQHNQLVNDFKDFDASYTTRLRLGQTSREQAARERADMREQLNMSTAQLQFKAKLHQIGKAELVLSGAFLSAATSAYHVFAETGNVLIQSNSSLTNRLALTRSILVTQQMLGSDMHQSVEAARELVDYGYDLDSTFESTLKLVIQMKDGLGLSVKLGAELAVVYNRQLRTSARDTADAIARLVNDTSVAADEAGRLAINIGRAVALLRPGVNADLSAVTELVGRYEGALKRLGGQFGGFESLLTKMTTPEGMLQAGVLGVNNPEFIRSKEATKQVIDQFADYAKSTLGNTQGWDRVLRLQNLSEIFGVTAQQINLMIRAVDEANQQRQTSITVEQRYKDQVFASAEVFNRLKNSLVAIAQQAVLPLIEVITGILKPVAEFIGQIKEFQGVVITAAVVLGAGAVLAVTQVYRLSAALYTMATAAHLSAVAMRQRAAAEFIGPVLPGAGGGASAMARMSSTIGRYIGIAAGPIMAGAIALSVGVAAGSLINKYLVNKDFGYNSVAMQSSTSEVVERSLRKFAMGADTGAVQGVVDKAITMYQTRDHMSAVAAAAKVARQVEHLDEIVGNIRFAKASAQHSLGNDPGFDDTMAKFSDAQVALLSIAVKQHEVAVEAIKIQKESDRNEVENENKKRMDQLINRSPVYIPPYQQFFK